MIPGGLSVWNVIKFAAAFLAAGVLYGLRALAALVRGRPLP